MNSHTIGFHLQTLGVKGGSERVNGSQQQTDLNLTPLHNGYIGFVKD